VIRVKICGLTRRDDVLWALDAGADAVGFVFAQESPRRADPGVVAGVIAELPTEVITVGVFRDQDWGLVRRLTQACGLGLVQLHGDEDAAGARALGVPVLKAMALVPGDADDPATAGRIARYGNGPVLLDAASPGSGRTADWAQARRVARCRKVVLAGGLGPHNVAAAIAAVGPWAVDASSGLESVPGVKDPEKVRAFVARARAAGDRYLDSARGHYPDPARGHYGDPAEEATGGSEQDRRERTANPWSTL
jgi:phosphoribosylanthranilate isomerase